MFSKTIMKSQPAAAAGSAQVHEMSAGAAWEGRLQAAMGDDTALLALAIDAASVDQKLSAVLALSSEDALRTAEREFRKHDRRVHSVAKQRYETLVKQRETRAAAAELIHAAAALVDAPMIPANRLVELNQAWELLDTTLIADQQKSEFARSQAGLAELMRGRTERKRSGSRWATEARQALAELNAAGAGIAADTDLHDLADRLAKAGEMARATLATLAAMPVTAASPVAEDGSVAALAAAIQAALQEATLIETRLALLGELRESPASQSGGLPHEKSGPPTAAALKAASERWQGLPPIADQRIESALTRRFDEWLQLQDETAKRLQKESRQRVSERDKALLQARVQVLTEQVTAAEAALVAGHLAEAGKQLAVLQTAAGQGGTSALLQKRIAALQAEFSRLKGWQHWGGGRVRDDLVVEAETLATSTVVAEGARPVKLPVKQLEKSIEQLRARWKELDRLGGATSKPLWQRFDAAMKTAYLPVAAHLARLSAARQENLAARKSLLAVLDALSLGADEPGTAPDWKEIGRALAHFQTEWRKLGPLEHTVPHKSQVALMERMKASVARLESPLAEVHANAQAQREQLIVRAKALGQDAQGRDLLAKLRELQSQWQNHARSQPLPRKVENHLWTEFRAASDALMSLREAAFSARDAGFKANQATREALIARLEELHQDTPAADIKRVLATVDTEWRKAGEAPRNQAARLESRYRTARDRALEHVAGSAQRTWNRTCDALLAKLALCAELDSADPALPPAAAGLQAHWADLPALPPRWEQVLQARYQSGCGHPGGDGEAVDQLLLQLESSLDIPSPEAFQMARRTLKLLAMKNAMEGRRSATPAPLDLEGMLVAAFGHTHLDAAQRQRLGAVVEAVRRSGSGNPRG
ncbi:MAG: DUF349 domain-containing protein [Rhodocyclaceae bacterium]|nr:MAG: DUF349 domain-containing protein [Rhodocyclaceae bacterium]